MPVAPPAGHDSILALQELVDLAAKIRSIRANLLVQQLVIVINVIALREIDQHLLRVFDARKKVAIIVTEYSCDPQHQGFRAAGRSSSERDHIGVEDLVQNVGGVV